MTTTPDGNESQPSAPGQPARPSEPARGWCLTAAEIAELVRRDWEDRTKQAAGWHVSQPEPGVLIWTTPSGRTYTKISEPLPV